MIEAILGIIGLLVAAFAFNHGRNVERDRASSIAKEAERRRKEQAAVEAGIAMKEAAAQRDRDVNRPATDFLTEEARRGGK